VVHHGWARPDAKLVTDRRPRTKRGNTGSNDRRLPHARGYDGRHHQRAYSGLGGYYPYYPSYSGSPDSGYDPYTDTSRPSGSQSDPGDSGSSDQPATSSGPSDEGLASTDQESSEAERCMDRARRAFQKGDYAEAQKECERAIRLLPGDPNLHEFGALCQFAQGKYKDAAATLYEVLTAKPVWVWDTLSSFYTSARTYTTQLRALERYVRENPKDAAGHFVLAYHYLALEERDATIGQLREVVKLQPRDQVSPALLEALEKLKDDNNVGPARRPAPGPGGAARSAGRSASADRGCADPARVCGLYTLFVGGDKAGGSRWPNRF
jgi:tetratricopeptide (TPR) repeat protein